MRGSGGLADAREERTLQQRLRGLFCCFLRQRVRPGGDVGQGEQTVRITVEDLGTVNAAFSLLDEEPPRRRAGSSLFLKESSAASSLSAQPDIQLIPPTPSGAADKGQFFNISPTDGGEHVSGYDGGREQKSCEEAEEASADLTPAEAGEKERDPLMSQTSKDEGKKPKFSRRSQQGASLAGHPRKSESAPPMPFHQSHISVLFATRRLTTPSESHYNTVPNACWRAHIVPRICDKMISHKCQKLTTIDGGCLFFFFFSICVVYQAD